MPGSRGKKCVKKSIKLPEGAKQLEKCDLKLLPPKRDYPPISKAVEDFCDSLASSGWQPFCGRPKQDIVGFYLICRWYKKEDTWAMLYLGRGHIKERLDAHFVGKHKSAINMYLSSFPKHSRNLLWVKWMKDPFFPYEGMSTEDVGNGLAQLYNNGELPAFNITMDVHVTAPRKNNEKLPENFSILNY